MICFRRADERDLAAAVSVLTAAFAEHEVYREKFRPLFGSSQSYIDFLNRLHAVMVKAAMRHHICLLAEVDGRLMAVATIHKLGNHPVGMLSFLRAGAWRMWKYIPQLLAFQKVFGGAVKKLRKGVFQLFILNYWVCCLIIKDRELAVFLSQRDLSCLPKKRNASGLL